MSANFTPTLNTYTDLTPFRFWCQKVLPLAYEDSLSYYELLCKVIDYLNKTMEDVTLSIEDVTALHAAYVSLQGYVNNYFNNLDVQEEINIKLDALVANGTIHQIFTPDVLEILGVAEQASLDAIAAIPANVTAWLNEHILQETGYVIDDTLTVSGAAADAKVTGDKIGELKSDVNDIADVTIPVNLARHTIFLSNTAINYTNGLENNSNGLYASDYIDISGAEKIIYSRIQSTATSTPAQGMAFYDANKTYISGIPQQNNKPEWKYVPYETVVPENAKYIRYTANLTRESMGAGYVYDPDQCENSLTERVTKNETDIELLSDLLTVNPLGLHTLPENSGVLNAIKRCRQMTDIKWTPAVDLPRYMCAQPTAPSEGDYSVDDNITYLGVFKAGVEYKGIPYGRCNYLTNYGYDYTYVGMHIDFETFVTAVQNGESIISKENNTGSVSNHRSIQYAAVCSALTCYALGLSTYYPTANIPNIPGLQLITPLKNNNVYIDPGIIKLGDVLNKQSHHTAMITDIVKDSEGNVIYIEEAEATIVGEANPDVIGGQYGGLCRRVAFTVNDFFNRFGEYSLYRYAYIDSVTYTPSPFVNIGDELNMYRFEHLPCMPYMGENFKYKNGYIPNTKIAITTDDYAFLRVFKNGVEITGSPFTVNGVGYIETGFSGTGNYIAYLCNMNNGNNTKVSAKCHWTVET